MSGFKRKILIILVLFSYGDTNKISITKCCPYGEYVGLRKKCNGSEDLSYKFDEVTIYDQDIRKTGKKVLDVFNLVPSELRRFKLKTAFDFFEKYNTYLIEDGSVMQELPNTYDRWTQIDNDKFCIDVALPNGRNIFKPQVRLWIVPIPDTDDDFQDNIIFTLSGLLISSFFLILVLIVYSMLPEPKNLCGMILMAYMASLLGAFLMLSLLYISTIADVHTSIVCIGFTLVIYYFFLSYFCWMNVMSIDIWWTFRGYAKGRPIHRRGKKFQFAMYCTYAFGLPAAMTVMLGVIDNADLTHIPWFIKPDLIGAGCYLEGGGKFVYMYVPMLIIIVMNWVLFLMTALNIWRLSRGTAVLDSAHRTHRHRLLLYLKLSVIMGVSWVLEVVSSPASHIQAWYLSDAYNLLMGLFIFLIFVPLQEDL